MARSGYLLDALLVGGGLELVGGHVAEGAVQPGAVVPGDVLHGGAASGGPGRPGLVVEALTFQGREERLGERVVPALAGAARRQADPVVGRTHVEHRRQGLTADEPSPTDPIWDRSGSGARTSISC